MSTPSSAAAAPEHGGCLIVDKNERQQVLIRAWLQSQSIEHTQVLEAQHAVAACAARTFQVIFIDLDSQWEQPYASALEVASHIRSAGINRATPLVALTLNKFTDLPSVQRAGFNDVLYKPINKDELLASIKQWSQQLVNDPVDPLAGPDLDLSDLSLDFLAADLEQAPRAAQVLVVEDDVLTQRVIASLLHQLTDSVTQVYDGQQAITACQEKFFDLIFMDINLPMLSGVDATTHIRESSTLNKFTPIIAFTSSGTTEDYTRFGMNDLLQKPFTVERLKELFEQWTPFGNDLSMAQPQSPLETSPGINAARRSSSAAASPNLVRSNSSPMAQLVAGMRLSTPPPTVQSSPLGNHVLETRARSGSSPGLLQGINSFHQHQALQAYAAQQQQQQGHAAGMSQALPFDLSQFTSVTGQAAIPHGHAASGTVHAAGGSFSHHSRGRSKAQPKRKSQSTLDHTQKERNRRAAIVASCDAFRDLVPGVKTSDKATVFNFSVKYLEFLRSKLTPHQLDTFNREFMEVAKQQPDAGRLDFDSYSPASSQPGSPQPGRAMMSPARQAFSGPASPLSPLAHAASSS